MGRVGWACLVMILLTASCRRPNNSSNQGDAAVPHDPADASMEAHDAGVTDAAAPDDAGEPEDAGVVEDAGAVEDAGVEPPDAGTAEDAGVTFMRGTHVVETGGGLNNAASPGFRLEAAIGSITPAGESASPNFRLRAGPVAGP